MTRCHTARKRSACNPDASTALVSVIAWITLCVLTCGTVPVAVAQEQPLIVVRGPTVVAFFEPITQSDLEKDPDSNEALADFQFYAQQVRNQFDKAGIAFHAVYAHAFQVRDGKHLRTFRPTKITVGYYFVAPGKEPHIEYGVMTNDDLVAAARKYFGAPIS